MSTQYALESFRQHTQLTAASPDVAARRPLVESVENTINAAASKSAQTERAYRKSIYDFLVFLDDQANGLHEQYPEWFPVVTAQEQGRRTVYLYNESTPAALLWLVNAAVMDAFALQLAENASQGTVEARVNAVRTFLRVALRDNVLTHEQGQQLGLRPYTRRQKRQQQTVGRRLSVAEVKKLRAAVDTSTHKGKRDAAILDCMLYAGLRRAEAVNLSPSSITQDKGRYWLQVEGKGNKRRKLKIHDAFYQSISDWMGAAGIAFYTNTPLFRSVDRWDNVKDTPIDGNVVERITAEYAALAGLAPATGTHKLAPHDLRRTCARNAYDNGASLLRVQTMLGHSDPKTTAAYIGVGQDDSDTAVDYVRY